MDKPKAANRHTHTTLDTIELTPEIVRQWVVPPFQRLLRRNKKVREAVEKIKADGVIPGVITLVRITGDPTTYIGDGQHRGEAFLMSGLESCYADVRTHYFDLMSDAADEFDRQNTQLVTMRPDDHLRALEGTVDAIAQIRSACPFVGYDQIKRSRSESGPILSMSMTLRAWDSASRETPSSQQTSARDLAKEITPEKTELLIGFLKLAYEAWGRDQEYYRLWAILNLSLCMWLYRRIVLGEGTEISNGHQAGAGSKSVRLTPEQFRQCMTALSASPKYLDWLVGRNLTDRDRSPAYARIKKIFATRLVRENIRRVKLPTPAWDTYGGNGNAYLNAILSAPAAQSIAQPAA